MPSINYTDEYVNKNRFSWPFFIFFNTFFLVLFLIVFYENLVGRTSPSWDFLTGYLITDFAWWHEGSFLDPVEFVPYAYSGVPGYLIGSTTTWYLPTGLLFYLNLFSIQSLVLLQIVTVYFGVVGMYLLSRVWGVSKWVSFIIALGFFFSSGFFSSASHPDIVRGWAFMPWILFFLAPQKNTSTLKFFLAVLVYFQFFVGVYPGILIASAYILPLYLISILILIKPNISQYLTFNLIAAALGTLLSMLKWLPLFFENRIKRGGNTVTPSSEMFLTLIYPQRSLTNFNELTQTSVFIVSLFILFLFLYRYFEVQILIFLPILLASLILGFEILFNKNQIAILPLLAESSRRTTDFKLFASISILILAGFALDQTLKEKLSLPRLILIFFLIAAFLLILRNQVDNFVISPLFFEADLYKGNLYAKYLAGVSFIIFTAIYFVTNFYKEYLTMVLPLMILFGVGLLGSLWALVNIETWSLPRDYNESLYLGDSLAQENYSENSGESVWREKRIGPQFPVNYESDFIFHVWSNVILTKNFSHGGYVGFLGSERLEWMKLLAETDESVDYFEILGKRLQGFVVDKNDITLNNDQCLLKNSCVIKEAFVQEGYWEGDRFSFEVLTPQQANLVINEVPWDGWFVEICASEKCEVKKVKSGIEQIFISTEVPTGSSRVTFFYETPLRKESWMIFWSALLITIVWPLYNTRKRRTKSD